MITIACQDLQVELCRPGEYYQGTRFDHAGVFRRIQKDGFTYADEWFSHQDPFAHDRVCGPSEEFVTVDLADVPVDGLFCKVGVGLLRRPDAAPYDWFRLYEIAHPGAWTVEADAASARYKHVLEGWYTYEKTVRLTDAGHLEIGHRLQWEASRPLKGFHYNHHFFTFGGAEVGLRRRITFPFQPAGHWRDSYDNVALTDCGIAFSGPIVKTPSVYMGDLQNSQGPTPYAFTIGEGARRVTVKGSQSVNHIVFWSNPRVACLEPYMPIELAAGQEMTWSQIYRFE